MRGSSRSRRGVQPKVRDLSLSRTYTHKRQAIDLSDHCASLSQHAARAAPLLLCLALALRYILES